MDPNHTQVFWSCTKTRFWDHIQCAVQGSRIQNPPLVLYLGHMGGTVQKGDQYLIEILLAAAKKAICKNRLQSAAADYSQCLNNIGDIQTMGRLTYR